MSTQLPLHTLGHVSIRARRVIGIDPGSVCAGYAVVEQRGTKLVRIASGVVACGRQPFNQRLATLYDAFRAVVHEHGPTEGAIEAIYHQKNAQSALKLGHARGAAILALVHARLDVAEYEPSKVKLAVTGRGRADKEQVAAMVRVLVGDFEPASHDETDALAVAICHLHQAPLLG